MRLWIVLRYVIALGAVALLTLIGALLWEHFRADSYSYSVAGNYLAAREAFEKGDGALAMRLYQQSLYARPHDARLQAGAFRAYLWEAKRAAALHLAPQLLDNSKQRRYALLLLLSEDLRTQDWERARARLELFGDTPLDRLLYHVGGSWLAYHDGDDAALLVHERGLDQHTGALRALADWQRAQLLELQGYPVRARARYRRALSGGGSRSPSYVANYARFLHRQGEGDEARQLLLAFTNRFGQHPLLRGVEASLAHPPSAPARSLDATLSEFLRVLSGAFAQAMQDERLVHAQLALLWKDTPAARLTLAEVYETQGYWRKADEHYRAIAESEPFFTDVQLLRAQMLSANGRANQALDLLKKMQARAPQEAILIAIADLHRGQEDYVAAEQTYNQVLQNSPQERSYWRIYFARAIVREELSKWPLAERDLLLAQRLSNDAPHVLNYLGYSWVDQGVRLREGLAMIQKAVRREPNNSAFVDSLGWAHFRLGNFARAVHYLERAVELGPLDPIVTDHYGDALWYVGRKEEARHEWQRALGLAPDANLRTSLEHKVGGQPPERHDITSSNL